MTEEIKIPKKGRPKGAKNKNGYNLSPAAYHQRTVANLKHGNDSAMFNKIIKKQIGDDEELQKEADDFRLALWKKFDTPSILLMDEYTNFRTLVAIKQMKAEDPTNKEIRECLKLLLDISKENNRLTTVSADKKMEAFTKGAYDEDFEQVVEVELVEPQVEVVDNVTQS